VIDTNALKGIIVTKGYSQRKLAKELGITEKTFYSKMNKGVFDSDEIENMIDILNIKNPIEIFFAKNVT
jgi:DNA-binding Xre family transcriptional regulator